MESNKNSTEPTLAEIIDSLYGGRVTPARDTLLCCDSEKDVATTFYKMIRSFCPELGIKELRHYVTPEELISDLSKDLASRVTLVISHDPHDRLNLTSRGPENPPSILSAAELASTLNKNPQLVDVPVILASGLADSSNELSPEIDAFFPKPATADEIRQAVQTAFRHRVKK